MRFRALIAGAATAAIAVGAVAAPAGAQVADGDDGSALITATVNNLGYRAVTLVSPITITSGLNSSSATGAYNVVVTEVTRNGTNPWTVTGALSGPLTNTDVDTTNDTIPNSAVAIHDRAAAATVGGGGSSDASAINGTADLTQARTLASWINQSSSLIYSGTYTLSGNLTVTPPTGSKTGVYTTNFVVTLTN